MDGTTQKTQEATFDHRVAGRFVHLDGEEMFEILNVDHMPAFLMSIVSDSDHWMFCTSKGGLTAGRVTPNRCLFPYETDDRLYRAHGTTGPFTLLSVVRSSGESVLWEPLTGPTYEPYRVRSLYKSLTGDRVVFEETRNDLGLTFRYRWDSSNSYGFVRTSTVSRHAHSDIEKIDVLDGLLNVMPANVPLGLQQSSSTLVEAYRRNEVDTATGMAIFSLESRITDRAEPAESLHANIVWSTGLPDAKVMITSRQIPAFREGRVIESESITRGARAHYLVSGSLRLNTADTASWMIVADVHQSHASIEQRRAQLLREPNPASEVDEDVNRGTRRLRKLIDSADGSQRTADRMAAAHHFANTLFNSMRGGVLVDNGAVPTDDFLDFLETRNRSVRRAHADWLSSLGERVMPRNLMSEVMKHADPDLERLTLEYLPITFSRRHGDPSRPWNMFAIRVKGEDGSRIFDYQGNWRDIFQNWEALCYSFPDYIESIIAKFVNASTVDGFNPYRLMRSGIDWEVPDPDDPWSNIGYWGDHQIVYLLRLLEASHRFHPGALQDSLNRDVYSYADVPYRLRPYDAIVRDPKNTIDFDRAHEREVQDRAAIIGSDGRLLLDSDRNVFHVTMAEKLLVPALAKLANLVIDGGIWMNTQRPEWNDANNALVGYGLSMVTLSYLRPYLEFCERLFSESSVDEFVVTREVADWLHETLAVLVTYEDRLDEPEINDRRRKRVLDALGAAFSDYRAKVYEFGFSGKAPIPVSAIIDLCRAGQRYAEHSIRANRRQSGLHHSYNLVQLEQDAKEMHVGHLPEMLEGQVAALSSGVLSADEALATVDALFASPLFRADQNSFLLYPADDLPSFLARNAIASAAVESNPLLSGLVDAEDSSIVERDALGTYRFAPQLPSKASLTEVLDRLSADPAWTDLVAAHRGDVYELFEQVFHHERFTGRSGSMYKYEGLGSIYWHMVSKLLLAVQEVFWRARDGAEDSDTEAAIADAYYRVRAGLSSDKTPQQYGAFPMDPYSHSPGHMGAQQPGMTGQVKEEVLTRFGELGVRVRDAQLTFDPVLLRRREFLDEEQRWSFFDATGTWTPLTLAEGSIGFTFCQVPVIYRLTDGPAETTVTRADGTSQTSAGSTLDVATSQALFEKQQSVRRIEVSLPGSLITRD